MHHSKGGITQNKTTSLLCHPQQLPKMSKLYSICNKCVMQKSVRGGHNHHLGSPRVKHIQINYSRQRRVIEFVLALAHNVLDPPDGKPHCPTRERCIIRLSKGI